MLTVLLCCVLGAVHLFDLFDEGLLDNGALQFLRGRQIACLFGEVRGQNHELLNFECLTASSQPESV